MVEANCGENTVRSFCEHIGSKGGTPNTQKRYEHDARDFLNFLGERKITPKILNEYKSLKLEEYSAASVKTILFGVNKYKEACKETGINSKKLL